MPKKHVEHFLNKTKKVKTMNDPCIRIIPVFPNTHKEWAKLLYIFTEMKKKVEDNLNLPFIIDIVDQKKEELEDEKRPFIDVSKF